VRLQVTVFAEMRRVKQLKREISRETDFWQASLVKAGRELALRGVE